MALLLTKLTTRYLCIRYSKAQSCKSHRFYTPDTYGNIFSRTTGRRSVTSSCCRPVGFSILQNDAKQTQGFNVEDHVDFFALLPEIQHNLVQLVASCNTPLAADWFDKALKYNFPCSKKQRGLLTVLTYKHLVKDKGRLDTEHIKLAQYLGWLVEMINSFYLITDDIMDNGTMRRNQPCWHRVNNVGTIAINDALMIESGVFMLLKQHFSHLDCYLNLMHCFLEAIFKTNCGQSMDVLTSRNTNVTNFTMKLYKAIIVNKTSYFSYYLPVILGIYLADLDKVEAVLQSKSILRNIGYLFQVQDDYLDSFGDIKGTGKLSNDIQENKCTWLSVICLERCNEKQKQIMKECYGQRDLEKVERIRELYKDLQLPNVYYKYEEQLFNEIKANIEKTCPEVPKTIFKNIINAMYRRTF